MIGHPAITLTPWKQTIWIPGMSPPVDWTMSNTFFSASSPSFFVGSPLNPWFLGTKATGDKASCSSKNVLTEIPGGASGEETAGLWTKSGIVLQQTSNAYMTRSSQTNPNNVQ